MKKYILILLVVLTSLVVFSGAVAAQVVPFEDAKPLEMFSVKDVDQVKLLLSGYHELASKDAFARVPNAGAILVSIAKSDNGFLRDRAVAALAKYWPSSDVFLLISSVIADPSATLGSRSRLMVILGETFQERAIPILATYLNDKDPQIRVSALQALQATQSDRAFKLIQAHRDTETEAFVLEAAKRYSRRVK